MANRFVSADSFKRILFLIPWICLLVCTRGMISFALGIDAGLFVMNWQQNTSSDMYIINCIVNSTRLYLTELSLQEQYSSGAVRKPLRKQTGDIKCFVEYPALGTCSTSGTMERLSVLAYISPSEEKCFICTAHFWQTNSWQNDTKFCVNGQTAVTSTTTSSQVLLSSEEPKIATASSCQECSESQHNDTVKGFLFLFVILFLIETGVIAAFIAHKLRTTRRSPEVLQRNRTDNSPMEDTRSSNVYVDIGGNREDNDQSRVFLSVANDSEMSLEYDKASASREDIDDPCQVSCGDVVDGYPPNPGSRVSPVDVVDGSQANRGCLVSREDVVHGYLTNRGSRAFREDVVDGEQTYPSRGSLDYIDGYQPNHGSSASRDEDFDDEQTHLKSRVSSDDVDGDQMYSKTSREYLDYIDDCQPNHGSWASRDDDFDDEHTPLKSRVPPDEVDGDQTYPKTVLQ